MCLIDDIHDYLIIMTLISIHFRYMFWKIQSGIVPPFFYVFIGEKEKLKLLRNSLCPKKQNMVQPTVQAEMVSVTVSK